MSTASLEHGGHSDYTAYTAPQSLRQAMPQFTPVQQNTRLGLRQTESNSSFKSVATSRSSRSAGTHGSVIRLVTEEAANRNVGGDLPYEINANGFGSGRA
jgi:hypothetical protein